MDCYRKLVDNLENIPQRKVARAKPQIKHLVGGEINLILSEMGDYLEAELKGPYEGLVRMAAAGTS